MKTTPNIRKADIHEKYIETTENAHEILFGDVVQLNI